MLNLLATRWTSYPPRITDTERGANTWTAIDIIFNTTVNKHQGYDGTNWNDLY